MTMTTNATIRAANNGYEFDYAGRVYRVWRHHTGRIVYKLNDARATYPRNVDNASRPGSAFCALLQGCAAMLAFPV